MKTYKIIKLNNSWSATRLANATEKRINELAEDGWEILNVSFGTSGHGYSSYITIYK